MDSLISIGRSASSESRCMRSKSAAQGKEPGDVFREECGLMGIWNHHEAANLCYLGLYAQQHRGQEGAGVVSLTDGPEPRMSVHRGLGLVAEVFHDYEFAQLPGNFAIGHVRYTTAGSNILANVQPFQAHISLGPVAVAHNGNLINAEALKDELIRSGAIFNSSSDTEVLLHLLARTPRKSGSRDTFVIEAVVGALQRIKGAYSFLILFEDRLLAVRDPNGFRPLSIGKLNGNYIVASETCAFDLIGAEFVRDVAPGELVEINLKGELRSFFPFGVTRESPCVFEYVYFARPDSRVFGRNVYRVRRCMGAELAREHPVKADLVVPVPDSGVTAALGYADVAKIPMELGLIRNHYVGRTFIEPKQAIRDFGVKVKHNANAEVLRGKSVVVVDDSIVRGTTSRKLIAMLRAAGARELHMRVSAPPTIDPCYYGIDTPQKSELIAANKSLAEIKEYLGVDTLAYLSVEGMYRAVMSAGGSSEDAAALQLGQGQSGGGAPAVAMPSSATRHGFCDACFTGNYPVGTPGQFGKRQTELL